MKNKTISILVIVDVVGALASGSLQDNVYLIDNNKKGGSLDEGKAVLKTRVHQGDQIIWNVLPLEPEAFTQISDIVIDPEYFEKNFYTYKVSDVTFWAGQIKKNPDVLPYTLKLKLGTHYHEFVTTDSPCFIGG